MNVSHEHADARAEKRIEIEALLKCYPDIPAETLSVLRHWFQREASAFDVAMLASNADLQKAYRAFREDHIDRFTTIDVARAILFAAAIVAVIAAIIWLGT